MQLVKPVAAVDGGSSQGESAGAMTDTPAARHQQWLEQIDSALRGQGLEAAARLSLQALAEGVEHPAVLNLAATARYGEGRFEEAAKLLKRAHALAPKDPHVLNSLGACLQALGRANDALQAYDEALGVDPRMAPAQFQSRQPAAGSQRYQRRTGRLPAGRGT